MIIQFIHPGHEHTPVTGVHWNNGEHRRKYLQVTGQYLENLDMHPQNDLLYFWGEWEAQSLVTTIAGNQLHMPQFVFQPYYQLPHGYANTDPFIFGNQFNYCFCKQPHYPTLRELNRGDIILFGSCQQKKFVLDTIFVVKDWLDYGISEINTLNYDDAFFQVSLMPISNAFNVERFAQQKAIISNENFCVPICGDDEDDNLPTDEPKKYRIYLAAMYEDREDFNGIFSYAPCLPQKNKGQNGFARPPVTLDVITDNLTQGIRISHINNSEEIWKNITKQVIKDGLCLLVSSELPNEKA